MKLFLLNYLVCPLDGKPLVLEIFRSEKVPLSIDDLETIRGRGHKESDFATEIMEGILLNPREKIYYPVYLGVPRLLVFEHPLLRNFHILFGSELQPFHDRGYSFPNKHSAPGERNVLASFSAEWTSYGYNDNVYWGQTTEAYNDSLFATLSSSSHDLRHKLVLEVGIGSGGSANDFSKRFVSNLIGLDLGYSTDVAFSLFRSNPFLHIVQASVFALPLAERTFDFVYSHGVIHHTFNTRTAFQSLSKLPKSGGHLYVWMYNMRNETRTVKRKIILALELLIRPWCSRLPGWLQTIVLQPIVPLYIFHQQAALDERKGMAKYNWRGALHAARDRFTPRYIHRHSESEVVGWFRENAYVEIKTLSDKELPDFVPVNFYMNTGVEGIRQ